MRWNLATNLLLASALLSAAPIAAQELNGSISGQVVLADGSAVPGVTVSIPVGGQRRIAVTDESGNYRFLNVPPGSYKVTTELEGFKTVTRDVAVRSGRSVSLDTLIETATPREEVIVSGASSDLLDAGASGGAVNDTPSTLPGSSLPPTGWDPTPFVEDLLMERGLNFALLRDSPSPLGRPLPRRRATVDVTIQLFIVDYLNAPTSNRFDGDRTVRADALAPDARVRLVSYGSESPPRQDPRLAVVATGESSGEAFELQLVTDGEQPMRVLAPDGLVLQPVLEGAGRALQAGSNEVMDRFPLVGFCLEFAKPPPLPGTEFQVAPQEVQQSYSSLREVLRAGRELADAGLLNPDSDPLGYAASIRQWAVWTRLESWDLPTFTGEFVDYTRKLAEARGVAWSEANAATLRRAAPNRFNDILNVLAEADSRINR